MRFWIREIMGWLLVLVGLLLFYLCVAILLGPRGLIAEAMMLSVVGIIVFRGGIHLLKVAVAARIAMQTQAEIAKPPVAKPVSKTEAPWDW
jgi:hypothetical protein